MPKRKTKPHHGGGPGFHRAFKEPTKIQRKEAIGTFPCPVGTAQPRHLMIEEAGQRLMAPPPPPPSQESDPSSNMANYGGAFTQEQFAPNDLDDANLYQPTNRSETTFSIPKPRDEQDWLACVPEKPQTFDDYTKFLMSRGGRMRPICNATRDDIVLVPIISGSAATNNNMWPKHGVPLGPLVQLTKAYFANRPVRLLPPAVILQQKDPNKKTTATKTKGTTTTTTKFDICFPTLSSSSSSSSEEEEDQIQISDDIVYEITGRVDKASGRVQYNVETLLSSLVNYRDDDDNDKAADGGPPLSKSSFCVMALTMEDLYQSPSDLFIAGLAAGGSKVAVFSFARYHPHMKIHPQSWYNYGYGVNADQYSYLDGERSQWIKQQQGLLQKPPTFDDLTPKWQSELYRRCGKLLVHELMHLYGLGHCIFNRCIMMGTGHLVEDFAAPFHLCGVCLRKMQWRLGFDVMGRYQLLADAFASMDLKGEETWTRKQVHDLRKKRGLLSS